MTGGVRIPEELTSVPPRALEDYVRARLVQFAGAFAARAAPNLGPADVRAAAAAAIAGLPPPERGGGSAARELQLVFRHDCLSLGCLDPQCALCEHNPARRCAVNFAPKYLVGDILRAKCDAPIRVEAIDRATGLPVGSDLPGVHLEVCILDGNAYDARCLEAGAERGADLAACGLLLNNKGGPLLGAGPGGSHAADGRVVVQLVRGAAALPDLHVTDSSEAMLSGRKPPFRLLVRAVRSDGGGDGGGAAPPARHAVSEGFVVATRRTRTAGKVEIPSVDDHISKLEHMGKETVKKLSDIAGSAAAAGTPIPPGSVPDNCVDRVGQFRRLALVAEADGHLRQKLQAVLKLSKEKWDDARDHALRAVVADGRMRIWYADPAPAGSVGAPPPAPDVGLLFTCRLGHVDLERPAGLLTRVVPKEGGGSTSSGPTYEATLMAQQTPAQRDVVRALAPRAAAAWWAPGHPGWAIYPADSEAFLATGALGPAAGGSGGGGRPGSSSGRPTRAGTAAAASPPLPRPPRPARRARTPRVAPCPASFPGRSPATSPACIQRAAWPWRPFRPSPSRRTSPAAPPAAPSRPAACRPSAWAAACSRPPTWTPCCPSGRRRGVGPAARPRPGPRPRPRRAP